MPEVLQNFTPNECNCNSYRAESNHYLTPHFDDRALSGPVLMNLSLGCDSIMTYINPEKNTNIEVDLPVNCLQLVTGISRYNYMHCIKAEGIKGDRRVSVTFRQAGSKNSIIKGVGVKKESKKDGHRTNPLITQISNPNPTNAAISI